jgi:hypothetical protein
MWVFRPSKGPSGTVSRPSATRETSAHRAAEGHGVLGRLGQGRLVASLTTSGGSLFQAWRYRPRIVWKGFLARTTTESGTILECYAMGTGRMYRVRAARAPSRIHPRPRRHPYRYVTLTPPSVQRSSPFAAAEKASHGDQSEAALTSCSDWNFATVTDPTMIGRTLDCAVHCLIHDVLDSRAPPNLTVQGSPEPVNTVQ